MAQDLVGLTALAAELNQELKNARISKIYQPSEDELVFNVRKNGDKTLLISANPNLARLHLTATKQQNPIGAPTFCMLLRKYLTGALVEKISVYNCDRIIAIELKNIGEMKDESHYVLLFESFGRYGNVILAKDDMTIIDALKRIYPDTSNRVVLPNVKYPLQPHGKVRLDDLDGVAKVFADGDISAKYFSQNLSGVNKYTAAEISASKSPQNKLKELLNVFGQKNYRPCVYIHGENAEILPCTYDTLGTPNKTFSSMSDAYDFYYAERAKSDKKRKDTRELNMLVKRLSEKYDDKIIECTKIVQNDEQIEKYKQFGELILSNMHLIKNGNSILKCINFYNNQPTEVPLDPLKSAQQNQEAYFKKYKKAKHAKQVAEDILNETIIAKKYLEEIASSIASSDTEKEYAEILEELYKLSGKFRNKNAGQKKRKELPSAPLKIVYENFVIYVGKNNQQNDAVTFNIAKSHDLWLHVKAYHGSHVIVLTDGRAVPQNVLRYAAELAAQYSQAKESEKVEVDYTERRNVKRSGKFLGLVNYINYETIVVDNKK